MENRTIILVDKLSAYLACLENWTEVFLWITVICLDGSFLSWLVKMISLLLKHDYYSLVTGSICKIFFIFQPKLKLEQSKNTLAYNISSPLKSLMNEFENTHSTTLSNKNNVLINNTVYHYFTKL